MLEELQKLQKAAVEEIQGVADLSVLEDLRVRYLGRKSPLRHIMGQIGQLPADQRPQLGQAAGATQKAIQAALDSQQHQLREAAEAGTRIDVTLPGRRPRYGSLHPLAQLTDELTDVFQGMGFDLADGPEAEDEYHNFDALNTPADHPARDLHDTFYLQDGGLLRTQIGRAHV